jgi:hypothetical protein
MEKGWWDGEERDDELDGEEKDGVSSVRAAVHY